MLYCRLRNITRKRVYQCTPISTPVQRMNQCRNASSWNSTMPWQNLKNPEPKRCSSNFTLLFHLKSTHRLRSAKWAWISRRVVEAETSKSMFVCEIRLGLKKKMIHWQCCLVHSWIWSKCTDQNVAENCLLVLREKWQCYEIDWSFQKVRRMWIFIIPFIEVYTLIHESCTYWKREAAVSLGKNCSGSD